MRCVSGWSRLAGGVWATAAQNPDGSFAMVVFNDNTTP
ncbi:MULTISPECIES: glycoside hydrolase family 30 beta sandwich domain-containing protein [unclassified Lentimonas]